MTKHDLELKRHDWRDRCTEHDLSPEHLFKILSGMYGENIALTKMVDLGLDISPWIKTAEADTEDG